MTGVSFKQAAYLPFDYWKTAASDGKFLIKTVDFTVSAHKLASKVAASYVVVECMGCIGAWAKPVSVMFKPFTDAIEPLKDVLEKGRELFNEGKYLKLASKVSLVAGLWLAVPVYFGGIGAFGLGVFATNVGTVQVLAAIDLIRFTLIQFGTAYKLYESRAKVAEKEELFQEAKADKEHWDQNGVESTDETTVTQKKWIAAKLLRSAEIELRNAKLDMLDSSTKVMNYSFTIFDAYVSPVATLTGVIAVQLFNKGVGCVKDYGATKKRQLQHTMEKWRREQQLETRHMTATRVA